MALVCLANFHSTDPDFVAQREQIRAAVHQATSLPVPDTVLEQLAGTLPQEHQAGALGLLRQLRQMMLQPAVGAAIGT